MSWRISLILVLLIVIIRLLQIYQYLRYTDNEIAAAIYCAEGGKGTRFPYGIKSINTGGNVAIAKAICLRTIRHGRERYRQAGYPGDFISFLGKRYAPGQGEWVHNVKWFLKDNRRSR